MKQYVIDELRPADHEKIKAFLDNKYGFFSIDNLFRIPLDKDILSEIQKKHTGCQPFYFSLNLKPDRISCEFLVRTKNKIRCDCVAYANEIQRNWLIKQINLVLDELGIIS